MSIEIDTLEPLEHLLNLYLDKHAVLTEYLPDETIDRIHNYEYIDPSQLFICDRLVVVRKNNGQYYKTGEIIKITSDKIIINNRQSNLSLNKNEYYFFKLPRKHNKKKKFYEELQKFLDN
jgi:hypothetical protein|tara:strand:+ start:388 stop:747 length:360 start_codon:yes stop_codon:yes gene_type:complete